MGGADCCAGSGGMVTVSVLKTSGAAGEQGPAMAAVVGNMDGEAEWQIGAGSLIPDVMDVGGIEIVREREGSSDGRTTVPMLLQYSGYCS